MTAPTRRLVAIVGACVAWVALSGCGASDSPDAADREVVAYVSADPQVAAPILAAFESATGIRVRPLHDTEATKTTGLANRIRREAERPRADVFWSSEPVAIERLASEGLLQAAVHPDLVDHPTAWRRADDRWFAFGGRARVLVFRPDRLDAGDVPSTWEALADPRWRDEVAIADPRFGTTRSHVAALAAAWKGDRFDAWLDGLAANRVRVLPGGNAATVDAVARGEVLLGCTDIDDVVAARRRGLAVSAVLPRHEPDDVDGGGTLLLPNAAAVVAGAPHPQSAAALVAFLASAEVERVLRASASRNQPVAHPEVDAAIVVPEDERFDELDPWRCSIPDLATAMDAAIDRAVATWLDGGRDEADAP